MAPTIANTSSKRPKERDRDGKSKRSSSVARERETKEERRERRREKRPVRVLEELEREKAGREKDGERAVVEKKVEEKKVEEKKVEKKVEEKKVEKKVEEKPAVKEVEKKVEKERPAVKERTLSTPALPTPPPKSDAEKEKETAREKEKDTAREKEKEKKRKSKRFAISLSEYEALKSQTVSERSSTTGPYATVFLLGHLSMLVIFLILLRAFTFFKEDGGTWWAFMGVFLIGNMSMVVIGLLAVKFVPAGKGKEEKLVEEKEQEGEKKEEKKETTTPQNASMVSLLAHTYPDAAAQPVETMHWFNVLLAQALHHTRSSFHDSDALTSTLTPLLNTSLPYFLSHITPTTFSLGNSYPLFTNARLSSHSPIRTLLDISLTDTYALGISTSLLLGIAALPISLTVSMTHFSGTIAVEFAPTEEDTGAVLRFCLLKGYKLETKVNSSVGRALRDIGMVENAVEGRIRAAVEERCVEPRWQVVEMPSFWPKRKRVEVLGDVDESAGKKKREPLGRAMTMPGAVGERDDLFSPW